MISEKYCIPKGWWRVVVFLGVFLSAASAQVWGPEKNLTSSPAGLYFSYSNARNVAVADDTVHVVWYDLRDGNAKIYYKRSEDNGESWGTDMSLTDGSGYASYPCIEVSSSNVHVVWQDNRDGSNKIYYRRSVDNGKTWDEEMRLRDAAGIYPSIVASGDTVHVVCTRSLYLICYKRSTDNGTSWEEDIEIADGSDMATLDVWGSDVHMAFNWGGNPSYMHSSDNGENWEPRIKIGSFRDEVFPSISAWGDNINVAWQGFWLSHGGRNIYHNRSANNGETWGTEILNSGLLLPNLASWGGNVYLVSHGKRNDKIGVYYMFSIDTGQSWSEDKRLTDDELAGGHPSVAVWGNDIHVVYTGERDGTPGLFYKYGTMVQPDNLIKNDFEGQYTGDKTYNLDGIGQSKTQRVNPGGTATFHIKIENDGNIPDKIVVKGQGATEGWTVRYYDALTGGSDITVPVTDTGWTTDKIEPENHIGMRLEIEPDYSVPLDSSFGVLLTSTSGSDSTKQDAVKATVITCVGVEESTPQIPVDYYLEVSANPPVIQYGIPKACRANIVIFDVSGRAVRTLTSEKQSAGHYRIEWDGCDDNGINLPTGVYFCQLRMKEHSTACKLVLLR